MSTILDETLVITDEQRTAVSRLVAGKPDAVLLLAMLLGEPLGERAEPVVRKYSPLTNEERQQMRELHARGLSLRRIEAATGRSRTLVVKALEEGAA